MATQSWLAFFNLFIVGYITSHITYTQALVQALLSSNYYEGVFDQFKTYQHAVTYDF